MLLELALRRRICLLRDPSQKRLPLSERLIEVLDARQTGETLLDECLRMMQGQEALPGGPERMSVNGWIDLLSGETWNIMKISFQLKQVRERLAKGLVDKGVLRTEKRNFLLFDMATHPVADAATKAGLVARAAALLTATTSAVPVAALAKDEQENARTTRAVCLVCCASAASVLEGAFARLGYEEREGAFQRAEDILAEFAQWPFGASSASATPAQKRRAAAAAATGARIGAGSSGAGPGGGRDALAGLVAGVKGEMQSTGPGTSEGEDLCFELVAAVLDVLSRLDSLL